MVASRAGQTHVPAERCDLLCLSLPRAEELRAKLLGTAAAERAASRAQALSDPTRFRIAAVLADVPELCVCDLAWICQRSQNLVSHHLRSLREAGLVESRREKKMVIYSLSASGRELVRALSAVQ